MRLILAPANLVIHRARLERAVGLLQQGYEALDKEKQFDKMKQYQALDHITVLLEQLVSLCWSSGYHNF